MARMHINCPPWVGENFEFSISEMAKNAFKLFTKVEENFENSIPEMANFPLVPHIFKQL